MIVHGVQPHEIGAIFPMLAPWIFTIPRMKDRFRAADVRRELADGSWQAWAFIDGQVEGVLLTTIQQFPLARELHLIGIAGNRMDEWVAQMPAIENFAHDNGCDRVVMLGARKGFAKIFPDYDGGHVVLEKRL